jgi:flagellar biosynthesis/type III secretory pathway chaperone
MDKDNYVAVLVQTLEKQCTALQEILAITQKQSEIAATEDFEEGMLEDTLNRKEILIARLNELDAGFVSVYGRVRKELDGHRDKYKKELEQIQELIKKCTDLGVEIQVLEERNRDKMAQCFAGKQKLYNSKKTAATVAARYHRTMYGNGAGSYHFSKKK